MHWFYTTFLAVYWFVWVYIQKKEPQHFISWDKIRPNLFYNIDILCFSTLLVLLF